MEAKFKILHSRELTTTTPDPNPECIGMVYDIQLDDADGVMVQYRVSVIEGHVPGEDIWTITTFGVSGHDIDPSSRFGQKIVDFVKLDMVCKSFIDDDWDYVSEPKSIFIKSDDSGSRRFSEQNFS